MVDPSIIDNRLQYLDMLMVDRLRSWARNIQQSGNGDITLWGAPQFVAAEMCRMADDIEMAIKTAPRSPAIDIESEE